MDYGSDSGSPEIKNILAIVEQYHRAGDPAVVALVRRLAAVEMDYGSDSGSLKIEAILAIVEQYHRAGDPAVVALVRRLAAVKLEEQRTSWVRVAADEVENFMAKIIKELLSP